MTKPGYTHITLVIDRSGSMAGIKDDMNGGIRSFIQEQMKQPGDLTISAVTFDTQIETVFQFAEPQDVLDGPELVSPRGGTALLDGIGQAVSDTGHTLLETDEDKRPEHVIVFVVTDGMENASQEWDVTGVKNIVDTQTNKYGWQFVFLGANIDAFNVAGNLGFARGATINYAANAGGTGSVLRSASAYVSSTRSGLATEFSDEDRAAATES